MGQLRYIMSAILVLLFIFLFHGFFINISNWTRPESDTVAPEFEKKASMMSANEKQGEMLYLNHCLACHSSFDVDDGAYFTLSGLGQRWPNKSELVSFIRRSDDEGLKNNSRVKEIRERRSKQADRYHEFPQLTDENIQMILDYILWKVGTEKY